MSGRFDVHDLDRRITMLEKVERAAGGAGSITSTGTFALTTGVATSTVKPDLSVSATSVIFYTPSDAGGWSLDGALNGITAAAGQFTISHSASALTRSYKYISFTPA